jgi:hypothetical protein
MPEAIVFIPLQVFLNCIITLAKTNCQYITSSTTKQPLLGYRGHSLTNKYSYQYTASSPLIYKQDLPKLNCTTMLYYVTVSWIISRIALIAGMAGKI